MRQCAPITTSSSTIANSPIFTCGPTRASGCTRAVVATQAEGSTGISLYDREVMRVSEIAGRLNAKFEGDGELEITSAAPLESAGPTEIAFVQNRKAAAHA